MRTNLSKKLLAAVLSLAMVLSLVGIQPSNANAASYKITKKAEMKAGKTVTYKVTGVKKTQYIKVTKKNANVTVKYNNKKVSTSKKIAGTGKALSLKVTAKEVNKDYTNKMTVKIYNKKNNKVVKTLTVSTKVLTQVKEEEPTPEEPTPEEPVVEQPTSAKVEATHVKELVVEFDKAVDTTKASLVITKGNAKPTATVTWSEDKKTATVAMGAKLTAGTYTATLTGYANEVVATVDTKDETVAGFDISENLVCDPTFNAGLGKATVFFTVVNQYGDQMTTSDTINVSSTFDAGARVKVTPTATKTGVIEVNITNAYLGIVGTKGSVTVIDGTIGVSTTKEIVLSSAATANELTMAGIYNVNKAKFMDITADDTASNFAILFTVKDQYGNDLSSDPNGSAMSNITYSIAGGTTNLTKGTVGTKMVDGVTYVSLPLAVVPASSLAAGTATVTIVNSNRGLLYSGSIDVAYGKTISKIAISANGPIYNGEVNVLSYDVVDSEGNQVTDYKTLKSLVTFPAGVGYAIDWSKKANGSADLVLTPNKSFDLTDKNDKSTDLITVTYYGNQSEVRKQIVGTQGFTVSENRKIVAISGVSGGSVVSGSIAEGVSLDLSDVIFEDQYSNAITSKDTSAVAELGYKSLFSSTYTTSTTTVNYAFDVTDEFPAKCDKAYYYEHYKTWFLDFAAVNTGSTTVYLKYKKPASKADHDYKITVSAVDTTTDVSGLKVNYIAYGYMIQATENVPVTADDIWGCQIVGTVGGSETAIPSAQYAIKEVVAPAITTQDIAKGVTTKTGTVTFVVSTYDKQNNEITNEVTSEFKYSVDDSVITSISAKDVDDLGTLKSTNAKKLTAHDFVKAFTFRDQYYNKLDSNWVETLVGFSASVTSATVAANLDSVSTVKSGTPSVVMTLAADTYVVEITATYGSGENKLEKKNTVKFAVQASEAAGNQAAIEDDAEELIDLLSGSYKASDVLPVEGTLTNGSRFEVTTPGKVGATGAVTGMTGNYDYDATTVYTLYLGSGATAKTETVKLGIIYHDAQGAKTACYEVKAVKSADGAALTKWEADKAVEWAKKYVSDNMLAKIGATDKFDCTATLTTEGNAELTVEEYDPASIYDTTDGTVALTGKADKKAYLEVKIHKASCTEDKYLYFTVTNNHGDGTDATAYTVTNWSATDEAVVTAALQEEITSYDTAIKELTTNETTDIGTLGTMSNYTVSVVAISNADEVFNTTGNKLVITGKANKEAVLEVTFTNKFNADPVVKYYTVRVNNVPDAYTVTSSTNDEISAAQLVYAKKKVAEMAVNSSLTTAAINKNILDAAKYDGTVSKIAVKTAAAAGAESLTVTVTYSDDTTKDLTFTNMTALTQAISAGTVLYVAE